MNKILFEKQYNEDNGYISSIIRNGILAGIIAGIFFIIAEMAIAGLSQNGTFIGPLKMIAGIPLQQAPGTITNGEALMFGLSFHMIYSIALGIIAAFLATIPICRSSPACLIVLGMFFGTFIWLINFYVLAPAINAPWFGGANPLTQFLLHTFLFGMILGIYFASVHFKVPSVPSLYWKIKGSR